VLPHVPAFAIDVGHRAHGVHVVRRQWLGVQDVEGDAAAACFDGGPLQRPVARVGAIDAHHEALGERRLGRQGRMAVPDDRDRCPRPADQPVACRPQYQLTEPTEAAGADDDEVGLFGLVHQHVRRRSASRGLGVRTPGDRVERFLMAIDDRGEGGIGRSMAVGGRDGPGPPAVNVHKVQRRAGRRCLSQRPPQRGVRVRRSVDSDDDGVHRPGPCVDNAVLRSFPIARNQCGSRRVVRDPVT